MKFNYQKDSSTYNVYLEYTDTEIHIKADSVAEARDIFIDRMRKLFDDTVNEKLKDWF